MHDSRSPLPRLIPTRLPESGVFALATFAVVLLTVSVYWQVNAAGFAWDDFKFLLESGWMTDRSRWPDLMKHGFPEWAGYYRPLGVVLYIVETNLAGFSPAPMHLLSLGIHLANIILVGMLARSLMRECSEPAASGRLQTIAWPFAAMCLYALHPALVEPVVWISAQYDMLTTGFILLGLVLNLRLRNIVLRAAGVAVCFFLAACAKEAALSFPFLLAIFDWLCARRAPVNHLPEREASSSALRAIAARQWPVYAAVLVAGIAYLCLRAWGLGFLINPATKATWSFWPQFQTTCFTYLAYWKLIVWPMSSLAPTYEVAVAPFATVSLKLLLVDAGAIAIAALGLWQLWRRTALGAAIAGASAALLPVLHIIPQEFAGSLYHCRYAMTAIATTCALVPLLLHGAKLHERSALLARSAAFCGCVWLAFATINTRICIPLWSDDVKLWQWALLENPGSSKVQESLLGAYIRTNDYDRAKVLADSMMQGEARSSFGSMLNIAALRIALHDAEGAAIALAQAKEDMSPSSIRYSYLRSYMLLSGQSAELGNDPVEAEEAYRAAIAFEPQLPEGYMRLAMLMARAGKSDEARTLYDRALALYTPADRARIRQQFDSMFKDPANTRTDDIAPGTVAH